MFLEPGPAHPHRLRAAADLATWLGVSEADVLRWRDAGMPTDADSLHDPFLAANWLCSHALEQCPALARRWRAYLAWFSLHIRGEDRPRHVRIRRQHTAYLPRPHVLARWWLPRLPTTTLQHVSAIEWPAAPVGMLPDSVHELPTHTLLEWHADSRLPTVASEEVVALTPMPPLRDDVIAAAVTEVASTFQYVYRHHRPDDLVGPARTEGSCLDCALALGQRLSVLARPWRLVAGVVARDDLANPHFWLEVDTVSGWRTVDPSLPAIARMLGADWRPWVTAYVGGGDTRRIAIAVSTHQVDALAFPSPLREVPGGPALAALIGELAVARDGLWTNAWPCLDWVCGECSYTFSEAGTDG